MSFSIIVSQHGDDVIRAMLAYAQSETLNLTTKLALTDFVDNFAAVEDFRNVQIQRLDTKVIEPMLQYGSSCKKAKERIKEAFATHAKESKLRNAATKATKKSGKEGQLTAQQGLTDSLKANRDLEEEIDSFERKKLHDIKTLMFDFVNVELSFHSKALEMFTLCYRSITTIREDQDMQQFRESLRPMARHSDQLDQLPNDSNSSSLGLTLLKAPRLVEAMVAKDRGGGQEARHNSNRLTEEATLQPPQQSPVSSSLGSSYLSQSEESNGSTEDDGANIFGDAETPEETSDENKMSQRNWVGK